MSNGTSDRKNTYQREAERLGCGALLTIWPIMKAILWAYMQGAGTRTVPCAQKQVSVTRPPQKSTKELITSQEQSHTLKTCERT